MSATAHEWGAIGLCLDACFPTCFGRYVVEPPAFSRMDERRIILIVENCKSSRWPRIYSPLATGLSDREKTVRKARNTGNPPIVKMTKIASKQTYQQRHNLHRAGMLCVVLFLAGKLFIVQCGLHYKGILLCVIPFYSQTQHGIEKSQLLCI